MLSGSSSGSGGVRGGGSPHGQPAVLDERERRCVRGGRVGRGGGHLGGRPVEGEVQQGDPALPQGAARNCRSVAGGGTHLHDIRTHSCSQTRGLCSWRALLAHTLGLKPFLCSLIQLYLLLLHAAVRSGIGGDAGGERCGALGEPHWRGLLALLRMLA